MPAPRTQLLIPDTQAKPGVPTDHLRWIGSYIVEKRPDAVVHLGDHADMPSLSTWDAGKRDFEGRRYSVDIEAANEAWSVLNAPLDAYNAQRRAFKERQWWPERHILLGNHEDRIDRAANDDAKLTGLISTDDLDYARSGWTVHPFLEPVCLDGIWMSHYWANHMNGRPMGGTALARLKNIGHSYAMGHQQTLDFATRFLANGEQQIGIVAGACYLHREEYKGQGNAHWRGIVVLHQVENGAADPMFVSLDYLCRKYEGVTLAEFMAEQYGLDLSGSPLH